ncbi:MAG: type II CAAX prenyl endopeptidase Rce1 family protein [Spirochaetota bacterium]
MFYFFFFFIPEQILTFFIEQIGKNNSSILNNNLFVVFFHITTGVVVAGLAIFLIFIIFILFKKLWINAVRHSNFGKYLEKELTPVFGNFDWWLCLLVCFCSEILIEYWQIFRPMATNYSTIKAVFELFFSDEKMTGAMRSLIRMLNYYGVSIVFYMLLPLALLIGRHIVAKDRDYIGYTFSFGKWKVGLTLLILCWAFMLIVLYFAIGLSPELRNLYPLGGNKALLDNLGLFIVYELGALLYFIAFEYFFRGALYFEFEEKIGNYAILIMILPYIIHKFGKPEIEIISAIIAGLAFGIICRWTRTFIYGALLHFLVALSADVMATLYREGIIKFFL